MNAREARWFDNPGRGQSLPLTGYDEYEAETFFAMLGMAIRVMNPGELATVPEGRPLGLLLRRRGRRAIQRELAGGNAGQRARIRALSAVAADTLPRRVPA
jgi:hypothetical protein